MPNNINYHFDEEKFERLIDALEEGRKSDATTVNSNTKSETKFNQKNFLSVLGVGGAFVAGCGITAVTAFCCVILCAVFHTILFMIIPVIIAAVAFVAPMAFGV